MLGAVLASQHRFRDAIAAAERARAIEPADAWNDGVIGDAHLELGEYDAAFAAFDAMMRKRPSAAAYGRASYARELQGDLAGAMRLMQMALDATSAHDPESQAWHHAQVGDLHYQRGHLADAERAYRHAAFTFADHPLAVAGLARVDAARGDLTAALAGYQRLQASAAAPEYAARMAEIEQALGRPLDAARHVALAEQGWRHDMPEPAHLARLLAGDATRAADALVIAEEAAAARQDIFTMDAVAWAAFRAGRLARAVEASRLALRTGSRDRAILYHAAAIAAAAGERARAKALVTDALDGHPTFDLVLATEARALLASL
jgi:tetratricopeptide (TPR) repeat protein